ncbi:MAG: tRNA (adenosine(37)-N6)-dimethylallyltransferase MiaA [Acidobacteria bacterium]|nr:tRNA (adenosine(37)-N6)-dimethylallyltransferase MiaA [Acidobacteriota bacterium]
MTAAVEPVPLLAIVGPTASGKSDLGIALAERFAGEVINCDSVQCYRRLYVATAKVPLAEQRGIPHHLIDIVDPTENFTAVAWAERAREIIADIEARGKRAFLVGGTGFYLRALTTQFFAAPEIDERLRPRLQRILQRHGPEHLHRMLQRVDAPLAEKFAPKDWSRVSRALEVYFSSGRPLSAWQADTPEVPTEFAARLHYFVLEPPREELYDRINRRVDIMVANGLLAEIEQLVAEGVPLDAKAFNAHGYKRFVEYLRGERSLESAIEQMKLDTRHYAKRQWTWWRAQTNTHWLRGFGWEDRVIADASQAVQLLVGASQTQGG